MPVLDKAVQHVAVTAAVHQRFESSALLEQDFRTFELDDLPCVKHKYLVGHHDRLESMCDNNERGVDKLSGDCVLDGLIRLVVNRRSRFV